MIHYFKQAIGFIKRNKTYAFTSSLGLSISLLLVVLLSVYFSIENNVDNYHAGSKNVYRVLRNNDCTFSPPFGSYLVDKLNEIDEYCRTFCLDGVLKSDYNMVKSEQCFYADSNFFSLFSLPLKVGNPKKVLETRNSIVLTESFARILFKDENPVGKKVDFNGRLSYTVSGIAEDFKQRTHFKNPDVIFPFGAMADFMGEGSNYLTQYEWRFLLPSLYVKTNTNKLKSAEQKVLSDAKTWYWLFSEDKNSTLNFQPLSKVYLNQANYGYAKNVRSGNKNVLSLTLFIILAVSIIAFVNFINLSISKANSRNAEFLIKRINGANKGYYFFNFVLEQICIVFLSLILSLFLLYLLLPVFNNLLTYDLSLITIVKNALVQKITALFTLFAIGIGVTVFYSNIVFVKRLSLNIADHKKHVRKLQKGLLVFQFTISITLLITMLGIFKQKNFLFNYDLGFNKTETLYVKMNRDFLGKAEVFKQEIEKISGVNSVSLCNGMPGVGIFDLKFEKNGQFKSIDLFHMDADYFKTMGINVGVNSMLDENSCWINESAAKALDYSINVGWIEFEEFNVNRKLKVVGILPDMNFHSLYQKARPTIFSKINTNVFIDYALLNVNPKKISEILPNLEYEYLNFSESFPFEYAFLNDKINQAYNKEAKTLKVITIFSLFGMLLSLIGMIALAVLFINSKIKEIGIRKVNGAKVSEILNLFAGAYVYWISIAFLLASPLAYFVMNSWLQNFAYKTDLSWWIFGFSGLFTLAVVILTIGFQTLQAARRNPVEALRYE